MGRESDSQYMRDIKEARLRSSHPFPHLLLVVVGLFFAAGITWASQAIIDEVTTGMGQVIPSGRVQVVQSLEGGILADMDVIEGEEVQQGQILLRIDDTSAASSYRDYVAQRQALQVAIARLTAEAEGKPLVFSEQMKKDNPGLVAKETALFLSRKQTLSASIKSLTDSYKTSLKEKQALEAGVTRLAAEAGGTRPSFSKKLTKDQPLLVKAEMALYRARRKNHLESVSAMRGSLKLAKRELDLNLPLVPKGIVSEIEVLRLERQVIDLRREITEAENSFRVRAAQELNEKKAELLRAERQVTDLNARIEDRLNMFRTQAREEFTLKTNELVRIDEALVSMEARVKRTVVRSPVRGTVKKINITTIGAVIQSAEDIMEIVPLDDSLVVEAKIRPTDIAFITPGQKATVKITAYDFSIYGGLDGVVEHISADTITEGQGEPFYQVKVRTDKNFLEKHNKKLPIIPGMTTTVDVMTGRRTILEYLMKPFIKARYQAMRER